MATPQCMSNDGKQAVFIGTFFENGDSVTVCEDCFQAFVTATTAQMSGIPADVLQGVIEQLSTDEPADKTAAATEMAAPMHDVTHGAPTDQPPTPAPADPDHEAGQAQQSDPPMFGHTPNGSADLGMGEDHHTNHPPGSPEAETVAGA